MSRPVPLTPEDAAASYAVLLLRLTLGAVFIAHALLKALVLTLPGTATVFAAHGFPGWTAYPVFVAELLGGLALVAGVYSRVVALGLIPVLLGAFMVHWPNGWYFAAPDGGWEYIAVLIAGLVVQAGLGDGPLALTARARGVTRQRTISAALLVAALSGLGGAAMQAQSRLPPTGSIDGRTLARRYFDDVWNQGKVDVLDELLAPEYVNHTPSAGNPPPGPNGLKPIVLALRRAFPDLHFAIEDVIETSDAVVIRTRMTGTHRGDLFGIAPTHRTVDVMRPFLTRSI
jgi:putative oxidoreductase